jgi:hypothetical protein
MPLLATPGPIARRRLPVVVKQCTLEVWITAAQCRSLVTSTSACLIQVSLPEPPLALDSQSLGWARRPATPPAQEWTHHLSSQHNPQVGRTVLAGPRGTCKQGAGSCGLGVVDAGPARGCLRSVKRAIPAASTPR